MTKTIDPFRAILAGLTTVKGVVADKDAIMKVLGKFTASAAKVTKPSDGTVNTGRFTGLHVMEFQDTLYGHNMTKGWGFTDAELAVAWKAEFPSAKCDFASKHAYVTSARGDLNRNCRGTKIEQLNAKFKFEGPVQRFYAPVKEIKAKVVKVKASKAETEAAQVTEIPTVESVEAQATA